MRSDKTTRWRAVWRTRLYEREKVEVLGPGSVILEDSQLSLRILGYVNHGGSDFDVVLSEAPVADSASLVGVRSERKKSDLLRVAAPHELKTKFDPRSRNQHRIETDVRGAVGDGRPVYFS